MNDSVLFLDNPSASAEPATLPDSLPTLHGTGTVDAYRTEWPPRVALSVEDDGQFVLVLLSMPVARALMDRMAIAVTGNPMARAVILEGGL